MKARAKRSGKRRHKKSRKAAVIRHMPRKALKLRRRHSVSGKKANIKNIMGNMLSAGAGAASVILLSNMINKTMSTKGKSLSAQNMNWLKLALSIGLYFVMPKLKLSKYTESVTAGALAITLIDVAKTSFGLSDLLTHGDNQEEINRIIDNLNVSGYLEHEVNGEPSMQDLLGEDDDMFGIADSLAANEFED
jgi:hypothetical protein